jgi:hypothetical protein
MTLRGAGVAIVLVALTGCGSTKLATSDEGRPIRPNNAPTAEQPYPTAKLTDIAKSASGGVSDSMEDAYRSVLGKDRYAGLVDSNGHYILFIKGTVDANTITAAQNTANDLGLGTIQTRSVLFSEGEQKALMDTICGLGTIRDRVIQLCGISDLSRLPNAWLVDATEADLAAARAEWPNVEFESHEQIHLAFSTLPS